MTSHSSDVSCKLLGGLKSTLTSISWKETQNDRWYLQLVFGWIVHKVREQSAMNSDGATFVKTIAVEIAGSAP